MTDMPITRHHVWGHVRAWQCVNFTNIKHTYMMKFWNFFDFLNRFILHKLKRYQRKSLFPKGFELPFQQKCCYQCFFKLIIFLITQIRKMKTQDLEFLLGKMWPFACPNFNLQMQWNTKSHTNFNSQCHFLK
jgi:hypothetical protein